MRQPTNFFNVSQVCQAPEETPETFLERLIEAHKTQDLKASENRSAIGLAFANQSAPDISVSCRDYKIFKVRGWLSSLQLLSKYSAIGRPQETDLGASESFKQTNIGAHQSPSSCAR